MVYNGKNLVVNDKGVISLIDFNIAQVNNFPNTLKLNSRKNKLNHKQFYKRTENIIKKNKYLIIY